MKYILVWSFMSGSVHAAGMTVFETIEECVYSMQEMTLEHEQYTYIGCMITDS